MSNFLVIRTQTHNSFLNIVDDSPCLTNYLTVSKRKEEKKLPQNRQRWGQQNMLNVTPAIPRIMSYFRNFKLNKHQKPQRKLKHPHPEWFLFLPLSGITFCAAEYELSIDMSIPCWHYLHMDQATMNREIIPPSISTFVHTVISSTISTKLWKFSFIPYVWPQASFPRNPLSLAPRYRFEIPAQISGLMNYLTSPHFKFLFLKVETVMTQPLHHR